MGADFFNVAGVDKFAEFLIIFASGFGNPLICL
jgi:hypothetical protein